MAVNYSITSSARQVMRDGGPLTREQAMLRDARDDLSLEKSTMRQVSLRLLPFLMLCYLARASG
jgi:hypothetical protein